MPCQAKIVKNCVTVVKKGLGPPAGAPRQTIVEICATVDNFSLHPLKNLRFLMVFGGGPRGPQGHPKRPTRGLFAAMLPRRPQEAPKRPSRGPQEAPKRPPRAPQEAPKRPSRGRQEAFNTSAAGKDREWDFGPDRLWAAVLNHWMLRKCSSFSNLFPQVGKLAAFQTRFPFYAKTGLSCVS